MARFKKIYTKKVLLGLDFLHRRGIVHTDLQPVNILFSTAEVDRYDELLNPPVLIPVKWLEGVMQDDSAPEYLVTPQRHQARLDNIETSEILVKIGDLGGALRSDQFDQKPVTPVALRAPELIDMKPCDEKIDVWTLGCLIFELATHQLLFEAMPFFCAKEKTDEVYRDEIEHVLGSDFIKHLRDRLPPDFGYENVQSLASFLLLMLQWDPQKRLSITKLLRHFLLTGGESS